MTEPSATIARRVLARHGLDVDDRIAVAVALAVTAGSGYTAEDIAELLDLAGVAVAGRPETVAAAGAVVEALRAGEGT